MKMSELIESFRKVETNKDWGIELEKLGNEFGLSLWGEYYDGDELVSYYHQDATWICTDTRVGIKFFFLNDKFIGISSQRGRKSTEFFEWVSEETKNELFLWLVKNFVKNRNEETGDIINMDEDVSQWIKN